MGDAGIDLLEHTSGTDCWVVVAAWVLDATSFLADHPGGELAILTVAGMNATPEFNMISATPTTRATDWPREAADSLGDPPR